jgi:subtilisin family serine protease
VSSGTHVAGIIGAKNNGQGVVGVSPGAPIYSLKVLDAQGRGSISSVLAAVSWVATEGVKQGIRVINLSLATLVDPSNAEDYAATVDIVCSVFAEAEAAGVFVATAAGNYGELQRCCCSALLLSSGGTVIV